MCRHMKNEKKKNNQKEKEKENKQKTCAYIRNPLVHVRIYLPVALFIFYLFYMPANVTKK